MAVVLGHIWPFWRLEHLNCLAVAAREKEQSPDAVCFITSLLG